MTSSRVLSLDWETLQRAESPEGDEQASWGFQIRPAAPDLLPDLYRLAQRSGPAWWRACGAGLLPWWLFPAALGDQLWESWVLMHPDHPGAVAYAAIFDVSDGAAWLDAAWDPPLTDGCGHLINWLNDRVRAAGIAGAVYHPWLACRPLPTQVPWVPQGVIPDAFRWRGTRWDLNYAAILPQGPTP